MADMPPGMNPLDELEPIKFIPIGKKNHPTADGLVDHAHRNSTDRGYYIVGSDMDVVVAPTADNNYHCIVKASVDVKCSESGDTHRYTDIGDANPKNCTSENTAAAYPRMAATRALGRALAQAFNITEALAEEMLESGAAAPAQQSRPAQQGSAPAQQAAGNAAGGRPQGMPASHPQGWNGDVYWGSDHDGTKFKDYRPKLKIWDPAIDDGSLSWARDNLFPMKLRDKVTDDPNAYAMIEFEINRRAGGGDAAPAAPASTPNYGGGAKQAAPAAASGPRTIVSKDVADLMALGKAVGKTWPVVKQECADTFGVSEPIQLGWDDFNMLRTLLGGDPL